MLTGFEAQASGAVLDLTGDDDQAMRAKKNCVKWDAKKRKYVKADQARPDIFMFYLSMVLGYFEIIDTSIFFQIILFAQINSKCSCIIWVI